MKIDIATAGAMYASGLSIEKVAREMNVAAMTAHRAIHLSGEKIRDKSVSVDAGVVVSLYESGMTLREIGKNIGFGPSVVTRVLEENGVTKRAPGAWKKGTSRIDHSAIVRSYENGVTVLEICKQFKCGGTQVRRILSANNVQPKGTRFYRERDGNTSVEAGGYRWIRLSVGTWRREHVVIAEGVLGRRLRKGEVVHHIDQNGLNNEPSNLLICTAGYHTQLHNKIRKLKGDHQP